MNLNGEIFKRTNMPTYKYNYATLAGKKFRKLTAIKFVENRSGNNPYWLFKCVCGQTKVISVYSVVKNKTISCGCNREKMLSGGLVHKIHGMSKTRFYEIWKNMHRRCYSPKSSRYSSYGGRGIVVCNRWHKFENFRDDMYSDYLENSRKFGERKTTIDRIDNDGNYELSNCRWSAPKQQARNRRTSHFYFIKSQKFTLPEIAEKFNLDYKILNDRMKRGWNLQRAMNAPVRKIKV